MGSANPNDPNPARIVHARYMTAGGDPIVGLRANERADAVEAAAVGELPAQDIGGAEAAAGEFVDDPHDLLVEHHDTACLPQDRLEPGGG